MFNEDTMHEHIMDFADAGYHILLLRGVDDEGKCKCGNPDCKNQYKHPRIGSWSSAPKPTPDEVQNLIDNHVFEQSYGIVLKEDDLVVDFDPRNNESALTELNSALGIDVESESTLVIRTGSGGKHFFFKKPDDFNIVKNLSEIKGIDFLSKGSFVVGCGSHHISGDSYEFPIHDKSNPSEVGKSPETLLQLIERQEVILESAYEAGSSSISDLKEALSAIPNDDNTDYDSWLNIGMALAYETSGSIQGYALWEQWSEKSQKHDGTLMSKKWDSFGRMSSNTNPRTAGTIFRMAYENGYEQSYANEIDLSKFAVRNDAEKIVIKKAVSDEEMKIHEVPPELQKITGVMGDVVNYILSTAKYPLYMPSIAAALSFCATIIGRDFTTDYDNYSPLYIMSVAETGSGKEHPYSAISKIMYAARQEDLVKGEVTGKSAIVTELYRDPRCLFVKDEMAHWMQVIGSKNVSENKLSEVKSWMELFSKHDSTYASDSFTNLREILKNEEGVDDAKTRIIIQRPSVGLLGMTTPQKLADSMNRMMIQDGFLNRFLVMFAQEGDQMMNKNAKSTPVPQGILSWIEVIERRVMHENKGRNALGRNNYEKPLDPVVLKFSDEAMAVLDKYEADILKNKKVLRQSKLENMIVRNREKAMRISLTFELSKNPYADKVTKESIEFAIALVDYTFDQLVEYIGVEMVESQFDKRYKEAYDTIERFGEAGVLKRDLNKMHPFKSCDGKTRNEIYQYLMVDAQKIIQYEDDTGGRGRKPHRIIASKFVETGD